MFHIQPTPISWVLWAAMFAVPVVIILLGVYAYFFGGKKRLGNKHDWCHRYHRCTGCIRTSSVVKIL